MDIINIHEAKTHLSRLVEKAARGESFIIAKAGRPVVQVTAVDAAPKAKPRRLGFLVGQIVVPEDFDRLHQAEIESLFGIDEPPTDEQHGATAP